VTTALAALVLVVALACPVHMWWRHRRGEHPSCVPAGGAPDRDDLRARHLGLSQQLEALAAEEDRASERAAVGG
jgi:hypothetical protein